MKKVLLILCFLIGFQMRADAVIVDPYIQPIPNYFSAGTVINVGTPYYQYYCDPYYPYYCRNTYYSTGVYVSPYINVNFGWGRPYYHHVSSRPIYRPTVYHHSSPSVHHNAHHIAPVKHSSTHHSVSGGGHSHSAPSHGGHSHSSHGGKR